MSTDSSQRQGQAPKRPKVWAVGGGKGGVGKSVLATNLAVAVARLGHRCILVDADLGGANLHTMVGLPAPKLTLSALFNSESASLKELIVPTGIPNLELISGAHALLDMANPKYAQKLKLIRQVMTLEADVILLDLSAGSSFNVIDFFNTAHNPITVVVPTPTSIENAYHFLNAALHRRFKQAVAKAQATEVAARIFSERRTRGIGSPRELVRYLSETAPEAAVTIGKMMASLRPKLIVNQMRREEDANLGLQISTACRDFFGVNMEALGAVRNDDRVVASIIARRPLMASQPTCQISTVIESMAVQLLQQDKEAEKEVQNG